MRVESMSQMQVRNTPDVEIVVVRFTALGNARRKTGKYIKRFVPITIAIERIMQKKKKKTLFAYKLCQRMYYVAIIIVAYQ